MVRSVYVFLVRLHPRPFRERFGEEMVAVVDEAARVGGCGPLLADALVSVWRQWILRPGHQDAPLVEAAARSGDVPMFHVLDTSPPRRSALVNGALLSILFFSAVTSSVGHSRSFPRLLIGARHPRPHVLGVDRASVREAEPTTEVKVKPETEDPLRELAAMYFRSIRALGALDVDHDGIISASEIVTAPKALGKLDFNGDGRLSAEECGFDLGRTIRDLDFVRRARRDFMRLNPVLAALDADHEGEISNEEMQNSAAALRRLDRNHDGALAPAEVLPPDVAK